MALSAVSQCGRSFELCGALRLQKDFILEAVKVNGHALKYVDETLQDEEVVSAAIEQCGSTLSSILGSFEQRRKIKHVLQDKAGAEAPLGCELRACWATTVRSPRHRCHRSPLEPEWFQSYANLISLYCSSCFFPECVAKGSCFCLGGLGAGPCSFRFWDCGRERLRAFASVRFVPDALCPWDWP